MSLQDLQFVCPRTKKFSCPIHTVNKRGMNVPNMRGRRQTFQYGDEILSITKLLRKLEIVGYLEKDGPLTYASQCEKLRRLLRAQRMNLQLIGEHAARNPAVPGVQDMRYGTQRRKANLPRKTMKGEVLFGPERTRRTEAAGC